ncbi:hypothetical protein LPJ63_004017 [Coemansia sp. RSA 2711]|nr:hypothetical protein LPJ63_004017 [Coemansia sp. RSA 2711]KAJ2327560.1 hypothetical protein IWW51_001683 [Coemansia sp. RSA 2702]
MESPQLSVAGYHHQPHSAGYHYHHQQQQQQYSNQLSRMQPASAPVTDSVASQQQQQQQQRAMFHLNPAVHTTQISRDSAAPLNSYLLMPRMQQQQQQQKQQQYQQHQAAAAAAADRLVNMQQSPTNSISALPSVPHSTVLSEHSRRFEELNIGSYQGMGGWQM